MITFYNFGGASLPGTIAVDGASQPITGPGLSPSAFYDTTSDQTWVCWEAWTGGNRAVRVAVYDHATATWGRPYSVSHEGLTDDAHGAPAICMDADGYVHCFYGAHSSVIKYATTKAARDNSAWVKRTDIGSSHTYPHPVLVGSSLFLFVRGNSSQSLYRYKASVTAGVATWGAAKEVFQFASGRFYLGALVATGTSIHGIATYSDSGDTFRRDIYHFVYDTTDDSVDNSTGSTSTAVGSQPISKATADSSYIVIDQTTDNTDVPGFCRTSDGRLHLAYLEGTGAPYNIRYVNFASGSWSSPATVTTTTGSTTSVGFKEVIELVPRADDSIDLWYPNDDTNAFTWGGDMKRMSRTSGGSWSGVTDVIDGATYGLARPTAVRDADPDLLVLFAETANDETDANAGGLKVYAHGAGGFISRTISAYGPAPSPSSPATDDWFYNNALQVTFAGSNGSTSFTDVSRYAHALTANGNAQIQSNKLDLDGTGDYVQVADSWVWQFGSRMSVELFGVEFDDASSDQVLVGQYRASSGLRGWIALYDGTKQVLQFWVALAPNNITLVASAPFVPTTGSTSYDFGFYWDGTTVRIYVDGVVLDEATLTGPFVDAAQPLTIGCDFDTAGTARRFFNGRIAAARIARGKDRSGGTTTFTRHALPLPTSQTALTDSLWGSVIFLGEALADGTIRDASPYDWPLTNTAVTVSTGVQPLSGVNSMVFNGAAYLTIPDNPILELGAGDHTIETFARHSANTTQQWYVSKWVASGGQRSYGFGYRGDNATDIIQMARSTAGTSSATAADSAALTPSVGTFYHMAECRSGNDYRLFANGTQTGSTASLSGTLFNGSAGMQIGALDSVNGMNGYQAEVRVTKGARYTGNFTAPSAAFPRG